MNVKSVIKRSAVIRRSLAIVFHVVGLVVCYYLAFLLRFDFRLEERFETSFVRTLPFCIVIFLGLILLFRLHQGLWRFFTFRDCAITAFVLALGTTLLTVTVALWSGGTFHEYPRSVLPIFFLLFLAWEVGGRGLARIVREWRIGRGRGVGAKRIVAIGDTAESDQVLRSLGRGPAADGVVVGLISGVPGHAGRKIHGVPIFADKGDVGATLERLGANSLLILPPFTTPARIKSIVESVAERKISCDYRVIPAFDDIAAGRVDVGRSRRVKIEDLLEREAYEVDKERLRAFTQGKGVVVTGAGGSIGLEICRQVAAQSPSFLALIDSSEYQLFEAERELRRAYPELEMPVFTADVRQRDRVESAFRMLDGIDVVFHAAAYKHVDLMERNPVSCFHTNVIGTEVMAQAAEDSGASDFVLVSTDKAVRPTSMMGASKRIAERLVMERPESSTRFKAVRFGNVLGSSGSVVPIFREQIANGGPVTVTSPEVTRFFMTISEAVELVIAAGSRQEDRRVYVLEMGKPVKIDTLARRMIELSGFVPEVDIPIVYTGLKPGEKPYEELLTDDEGVTRTDNDRIWMVRKNDDAVLAERVDMGILLEILDADDSRALRCYAHERIPGSLLLRSVLGKVEDGPVTVSAG